MASPPKDIHDMGSTIQRTGVTRSYDVDTQDVGTPTSPSSVIYIHGAYGTDVSSTYLTGSDTVSSTTIATKQVKSLVTGVWYRVEVTYTAGGNTEQDYFDVLGSDNE